MAEKLAVLVALAALACSKPAPPAPPPPETAAPAPAPKQVVLARESAVRESGAVVLTRIDGSLHALVADEDDEAIVEIDLDRKAIVGSTALGARPRDLLLLADGRAAATLPDEDAVVVLARDDQGAFREVARKSTPAEPLAMALDPSDATLYVSTGSSHSLIALTATSLEERSRQTLAREPRAVLVSNDGARVFVSHATETFVSVAPAVGHEGKLDQREIGNRDACAGRSKCNGARLARNAQAIARVGEHIAIPAAQALPQPPIGVSKHTLCAPLPINPFTGDEIPGRGDRWPIDGYGIRNGELGPPISTDVVTLEEKDGSYVDAKLTRDNGPSCLLPRAAASIEGGVLVACRGSAKLVRYKGEPKAIAVPAGPVGVAVERDGAHAVAWSSFARALTRVDAGTGETLAQIEVPRRVSREEAWLRGRELFFTNGDRRISVDGRACGNCHVDGRDDGLTWATPKGGRRTRMLAGLGAQGPFGWTGENATFEQHVRTTVKNLGGTGLPDEDIAKLAAFVTKLPATRGAAPPDDEAKRGKSVFAAAECGSCHASGASDRMVHNVGTGGGFLTPTLAGVASRAQLMHDGRYATLDDLIARSPAMGRGTELSADDRRALVKYLQTL